jgi:hypothetical protein
MFDRDPLLSDSWDAVLDSAYDKAREKYVGDDPKPPRKPIWKLLKSILINRTIIDENADEIVKHMGMLSKYVGHFYPIYSQLNRACTAVHCDPHFPGLMKYADAFGGRPSTWRLYRHLTRFPSEQEMFELYITKEPGTVKVRPLER